MKNNIGQKGQTLIETALVLLLLLIILIGIAEFARAWYTKNSLKNAARQGARVAAVLTPNTNFTSTNTPSFSCGGISNSSCDGAALDPLIKAFCCQPGVSRDSSNPATAAVTCYSPSGVPLSDCSGSGGVISGGTVKVSGTYTFNFIIGGSPWPWPASTSLSVDASMRYE